jgi:DNA-binding NarL/FixJ family response regulator
MICVGEACNGAEVLEKATQLNPDIVVLDINMPGQDGLETLTKLKGIMPKLPVLILSMLPEEEYAPISLKSGASGYLVKDSAPSELIKSITKVAAGGRYVNPEVEDIVTLWGKGEKVSRCGKLSPREYQVMYGIVSGKSIKTIAEELSCSPKTVTTYRQHILDKLNMKNNSELIRYAINTFLWKKNSLKKNNS